MARAFMSYHIVQNSIQVLGLIGLGGRGHCEAYLGEFCRHLHPKQGSRLMVPSLSKGGNWAAMVQFTHSVVCGFAISTLGVIDSMASSFPGAKAGASVWLAIIL